MKHSHCVAMTDAIICQKKKDCAKSRKGIANVSIATAGRKC